MSQKTSIFEKPILSTKIKSVNVKPVESLIGYLVGPFCAMLANGIFTTYLTRYFRDVLFAEELAAGSPHVAAVETFLTLFPILSAILIVIGNLVAGQIVERTRTKAGKARPWILLSSVLLAVSSVLIFIQPSDNLTFKAVWLVIAYNLYYAVAFPLYNTANSTLTPLSTRNGKQRSVLASFVNMSLLGAVGAGSMIFPFLLGILIRPEMSLGTQKTYWLVLFIIVAVITFLGTVLQYYFTRERVTEEQLASPVKEEGKPGISVREQAKSVVS
ncbi:MAG: MFS transporter, partial [Candidatus Coproplasma sp.]